MTPLRVAKDAAIVTVIVVCLGFLIWQVVMGVAMTGLN